MTTKIWRLRKGADRRFRSGHPWVFSNEVQFPDSPKSSAATAIEPGEWVELWDAAGEKKLAGGFGNPKSLICFRKVDARNLSSDEIIRLLRQALESRRQSVALGADLDFSFRWFFGEADGIPGLVIDAFRRVEGGWVISIQAHTAGVNRILGQVLECVEAAFPLKRGQFASIIHNEMSVRKLEGLETEEARVAACPQGWELRHQAIVLRTHQKGLVVDLVQGQKTGFFLDQSDNVLQAKNLISAWAKGKTGIRGLDLCCYVGQWSSALAEAIPNSQWTFADVSEQALALATENVKPRVRSFDAKKVDLLKDFATLKGQEWDIVVCDPPALISGRKSIDVGKQAYRKIMADAMSVVKPGGWIIASSCSGLLSELEFAEVLARATVKSGRGRIQWIYRGGQAMDHPVLAEFPEGKYLKTWIGRVTS